METAILWHIGPLIDEIEIGHVHELAADAGREDGVAPLSEQTLLNLAAPGDAVTHLLTWQDSQLAGYAQIDARGKEPSVELVVRPSHRHRGLGSHLLAGALDRAGEASADTPRIWAHGDLPAARALAAKAALAPVRELLVLGRELGSPEEHAVPALPDDVLLRAFRPGADDEVWVALNSRAFAAHPEQGRITVADLRDRMAQDWFEPAGLLIAERHGVPVGFVWTKIPNDAPDLKEGEIYVVGVDPAVQGEGFGRLLTAAGLAHLARRGVRRALLYVDGDNAAALRTYERAGFGRWNADVQYAPKIA